MTNDIYRENLFEKGTAAEIRAWLKARKIKPLRVFMSRSASCVTVILRKQDYTQELGLEISKTFAAGHIDFRNDGYYYRKDADAFYKCADGIERRLMCRYIFVEPKRDPL